MSSCIKTKNSLALTKEKYKEKKEFHIFASLVIDPTLEVQVPSKGLPGNVLTIQRHTLCKVPEYGILNMVKTVEQLFT